MKTFIKASSYYLPEHKITNKDLVNVFPDWSVEKIATKIGVNQRFVATNDETSVDLAVKAAERLFLENNLERNAIDFILFCTQSPDFFLPTSACLIQERLGIPISAGALDFNLGCSGYVYGLSLAKGLVCGNIAKNILLLTGETYSKFIHPTDKSNRTIFGDAASANLISTEGIAEIGNFCLGTDGRGAENLIVKTGAFRNRQKLNDMSGDEYGNPVSSDYLYMNGSEIFNFTVDIVPKLVKETLIKNNLEQSEIDLFVFHQANKYMLHFLRKKLKIEEDKFLVNMSEVGNTVSSTIPIALFEAFKRGDIKGHVLLAGFGVGYSWGGTVLKI